MSNQSDPRIIDLTCRGCGGTMKPQPRNGVKVTPLPNGGVMFTQNDEPYLIRCPNCGRSFMTWTQGPETQASANTAQVHIKGNFSGDIVIGNGNTIVRNK